MKTKILIFALALILALAFGACDPHECRDDDCDKEHSVLSPNTKGG